MKIQITTGRYKGQILQVVDDSEKTVRATLLFGGTIALPKNSPLGIVYFQEVEE